eukprot:jgi/Galph1/1323/GphlegSOOS_G6014.1
METVSSYLTYLSSLETKLTALARKRAVKKTLPMITRLFLVATFLEDALRGILQRDLQVQFLHMVYHLPFFIAGLFLFVSITFAISTSVSILCRWHEDRAALLLVGYIIVQQLVYGNYAPLTHGKWGFLVRNLCLCGSLLIVVANSRLRKGCGLLPGFGGVKQTSKFPEYVQLISRCFMALLSLEFLSTMGWFGTIVSLPVIVAVLVGWKTQVCSLLLLTFYAIHNVLQSAFWFLMDTSMTLERDVKLFEFVQTVSIMGGLLLLSSSGPSALSFDERKKL